MNLNIEIVRLLYLKITMPQKKVKNEYISSYKWYFCINHAPFLD